MDNNHFITLYSPKKFIPYKQDEDFLIYLAKRDGLISDTSHAHYYILHTDKKMGTTRQTFEEGRIHRTYVYIPKYFRLVKQWYTLQRILREVEGNKIFVINNTFYQVSTHVLIKMYGWQSIKIVGTFFHLQRKGVKKKVIDTLERMHFRLAHKIVIISHSGFQYVPKKYLNKMIYKIPYFTYDVPKVKIEPRRTNRHSAVCLSRLEKEKDLESLIEAWQGVEKKWTLTIFGDGSQREYLNQKIISLGLSERIVIKEAIAHSLVWDTLWHYDAFVLTSPSEGLGIAFLEALYMKIPCIGLKVDGVRDTLGEDRGILINPDKLKEKLGEALEVALHLKNEKAWHDHIDNYFVKSVEPHLNYSIVEHL